MTHSHTLTHSRKVFQQLCLEVPRPTSSRAACTVQRTVTTGGHIPSAVLCVGVWCVCVCVCVYVCVCVCVCVCVYVTGTPAPVRLDPPGHNHDSVTRQATTTSVLPSGEQCGPKATRNGPKEARTNFT